MRYKIKRILITITGIALVLSLALFMLSPIIRLTREIENSQDRIINELDHVAIREAAMALLSDPSERPVDLIDLPQPIAQTVPKFVHISDGAVHIEYSGGFAHYGLIIDPNDRQARNAANTTNGAYYKVQKLSDNVYFYVAE